MTLRLAVWMTMGLLILAGVAISPRAESGQEEQTTPAATWSHLELGAGNYGGTGHVRDGRNSFPKRHPNQFLVLFKQLKKLIETRGPRGVFYINDWSLEYTLYAATKLAAFAKIKGYDEVEIRLLPGDFLAIELPLVDSMHLRNPEPAFLAKKSVTPQLQSLADHSREGLTLTTYKELGPLLRQQVQANGSKMSVETVEPNAAPYIYPDGTPIQDVVHDQVENSSFLITRKSTWPPSTKSTLPLGTPLALNKSCLWFSEALLNEMRDLPE